MLGQFGGLFGTLKGFGSLLVVFIAQKMMMRDIVKQIYQIKKKSEFKPAGAVYKDDIETKGADKELEV